MKQIDMNIRALPYAVEEAMNRLRVNIKFCGKNTKKILSDLIMIFLMTTFLNSCIP